MHYFFLTGLYSCKKTQQPLLTSSSLTIVNVVNNAGALVTNFDSNHRLTYYKTATIIDSNSYFQFSGYSGKIPLQLVQYADTTKQVLNIDLTITPGSMQTLFLTGTADRPDTILVKDQPPVYSLADSLAGIRFANLSPGSGDISINVLDGNQSVIVKKLPYKGVTTYIPFQDKANVPTKHLYVFEFRDAVSGNLLYSYTLGQLNGILLKNVTIALAGTQSNNTLSAMLINNYALDLNLQ